MGEGTFRHHSPTPRALRERVSSSGPTSLILFQNAEI